MGGGLEGLLGGGAAAAAAGGEGVNPLMAGLMGGAAPGMAAGKGMFGPGGGGGPVPPMPQRNPMFSDPAGDANGAKLIKSNPEMASAFGAMMSKPSGPGPAAPVPPPMGGDSSGSFEAKPTSNETVFGNDITGQNWKPSRGSVVMPEATPDAMPKPGPAGAPPAPSMFGPGRTISAPPSMPERNPALQATPGGLGFDSSAPRPPAGAQGAAAAKSPTLFGVEIPGVQRGQDVLRAAPTNPMLQTGMGLLASGYDGSNPYTNIASNLKGIQPHEIALRSANIADSAEGRKKKDAADEAKDAELRALMAQMMMGQMGMPGGGGEAGGGVASSQGQARLVR